MTAIELNETVISERSSLSLHNQTEGWLERTRTIEQIDPRTPARRTIQNERSRAEAYGTIGFLDWGL